MISTFQRFEKKLIVNNIQLSKLLPVIEKHMERDRYCIGGKTYFIQNIYFDDSLNTVVRRCMEHPVYKEKLRIRCYGIQTKDTPLFIELKKKYRGVTFKRRACLSQNELYDFLSQRRIPANADYMKKQVLGEIDYYMEKTPCVPKSYICYERSAFFDRSNPSVRLTFDSSVVSRRDMLDFEHPGVGTPIIPENQYIMEIKFADSMPLWLANAIAMSGARISGFSKYGRDYELETAENGVRLHA